MAALTIAPDAASLAAAGGNSTHTLTNAGAERLAFKVKSSNNNEYRVKPVFGFVEPGATANLEIARLSGVAKNDKMVIHFAPAAPDAADAQAAFAAAPSRRQRDPQHHRSLRNRNHKHKPKDVFFGCFVLFG